ncbi:MAG: ATP-binding protein [Candidatus Cloacimonadaceae bacterium]
MIKRVYDNLLELMDKGKVLVLYGSRQVGKTTLLKTSLADCGQKYLLVSGDNIKMREIIGSLDLDILKSFVEGYEIIAIDEAQRITNIGIGLKMLIDDNPDLRIIATGSSSFELAGQVGEPLTGRKKTLTLYPVWSGELLHQSNKFEIHNALESYLIYGLYPAVLTAKTVAQKKEILEELTHSYLLKDIFDFDKVRGSKRILDLLRLLAFQVGREVSLSELGQQLGIDSKTVARYLDLLEKAFVIINLRGYGSNLRKEITSKSKYFFYDNGIRNALIANFNPFKLRDDLGLLWENHIFIERLKKRSYQNIYANMFFWRSWSQQEVDLIEERDGKLFAYEIKWSAKKHKPPKSFMENYPESTWQIIDRSNYQNFTI